ncbi:type III secretion system effector protein [Myxococcus sp. K15C18031901]|uniref:type III secretion system effector protein n=1 Tax=Myxococcus dinghuensis TaxID=2906761 RepID=UPI0020A77353|nr:type III secretion system effector protein [Myxococcus dinghuensis]MCP3097309.1 type III secretion system effector protein [Myxococcus dinghuensis]
MPLLPTVRTKAEVIGLTRVLRNQLEGSVARADLFGTIDDFWGDYLEIRGERYRKRQEVLSLVEHSVYEFLTSSPQLARTGAVGRTAFLNLLSFLDDVQAEHTAVITEVMPETTVYAMDDDDLVTTHAWRALKGGNGSIRILDDDGFLAVPTRRDTQRFDGFRTKVLAAFARMLSTAGGRRLVTSVLAQPRLVRILPRTQSSVVSAVALREGLRRLNAMHGIPVPNTPVSDHVGPAITATSAEPMTPFNLARSLGSARANIDIISGTELPPLPDGGSDSLIALHPDICDSSFLALDATINPLPTPLFLTIAHELIHALHNAHGTARGQFPMCDYDNREEYETIQGGDPSENALRAEHRLGLRFGHSGLFSGELADYLEDHPQPRIPVERALTWR